MEEFLPRARDCKKKFRREIERKAEDVGGRRRREEGWRRRKKRGRQRWRK